MAEYINRKVLIKKIDDYFSKTDPNGQEQIGVLKCRSIIRETPSTDVAPVRNAEWIGVWYDGYADGSPVYAEFECSNCGCEHHADGEPTWRFCPDCGAKMDL